MFDLGDKQPDRRDIGTERLTQERDSRSSRMVTMVAWLMCWYMSISDQRTCTGEGRRHPEDPVPLVRVMLRIRRAATDSVARSCASSSYISVNVRRARATSGAVRHLPLCDLSSPLSSGSPTASTSKHSARSDP